MHTNIDINAGVKHRTPEFNANLDAPLLTSAEATQGSFLSINMKEGGVFGPHIEERTNVDLSFYDQNIHDSKRIRLPLVVAPSLQGSPQIFDHQKFGFTPGRYRNWL